MIKAKIYQSTIYRWLVKRTDNYQQNLRWLLYGFGLSIFGTLLVLTSNYFLPPTLWAEATALVGLVFVGIGIVLAALGYLSLSILRLLRFFIEPPHKR